MLIEYTSSAVQRDQNLGTSRICALGVCIGGRLWQEDDMEWILHPGQYRRIHLPVSWATTSISKLVGMNLMAGGMHLRRFTVAADECCTFYPPFLEKLAEQDLNVLKHLSYPSSQIAEHAMELSRKRSMKGTVVRGSPWDKTKAKTLASPDSDIFVDTTAIACAPRDRCTFLECTTGTSVIYDACGLALKEADVQHGKNSNGARQRSCLTVITTI
eukprot:5562633-Amphidinium_carterae.1